jgi:hypothetical protein
VQLAGDAPSLIILQLEQTRRKLAQILIGPVEFYCALLYCFFQFSSRCPQYFLTEEIITGEVAYSYDLFRLFQENGWLNIRRGVASIRESRTPRRAMSA